MCHPGGYGTKDGDDSAHSRGLEASHISNSKKLRSAHGGLFLGFMGITCAAVALTILVTPVDEVRMGYPFNFCILHDAPACVSLDARQEMSLTAQHNSLEVSSLLLCHTPLRRCIASL